MCDILYSISSQDFLFYSLAIGSLVLVGFTSYALVNLSDTLKKLTSVIDKIDDIVKSIDDLQNLIKYGLINIKKIFKSKGVK